MSLDGIFLHTIKCELQNRILGAKVDKVYEPTREDLILSLRTRDRDNVKLLLCARANSPRVSITTEQYENPASPPMLCMLLRKRLGGATLTDIHQESTDRILYLDFLATNEMGEKEKLTLVVEIMAQYSNVILIDRDKKIIDALKRVDYSKSSRRLILPGVTYELPPQQDKINIFENQDIKSLILAKGGTDKAYMSTIMGLSPVVARELETKTVDESIETLLSYKNGSNKYYLLKDENGKPFEFSYMPILQYGTAVETVEYDSAFSLLEDYYAKRDSIERMSHRTYDLRRVMINARERIARKLDIQRAELDKCADRETLRISAELINANLYKLERGATYFDLENYYDENKIMRVKVNPALTPAQNSQKYFKEYKKTYTAEKKLKEQIESGILELEYIETVLDALTRVENEKDIMSIRGELIDQGYIKNKYDAKGKLSKAKPQQKVSSLPPIEYTTSDGFRVLVGRNNLQNEKLSLKSANKLDMWLHTKDIPGSHVIIENKNGEISDKAIEEAAVIAARHSAAGESGAKKIPVDYTLVKNLKKPTGSRPGKVIFHENWTIYVDLPNQ
ncbi:MAG: NFACT family protein [Oscillospiraceae bacterium]|nr:NFACT family protein [Candidatus Limimonas egerieequi]